MSLTWHQIEQSAAAEPSRDGAVAGAVPCVVGRRVYLIGGTATKRGDPDISLSVYNYWWSRPEIPPCESYGERQPDDNDSARINHTAAAIRSSTARAEFATTYGAFQEGDIPPARIGQAAVVNPSRSSIIVFGGETTSAVAGVPFAKLSDIYEGVPKEPSGTLVWRSLLSGDERPDDGDGGTTCAAAAETPAPVAFHAACAVSIRGEWAMIVHGGVDQNTALLGDLWAFRYRRGDVGRTDGAGSNEQTAEFSWERLAPDGQGPPPTAYHSASPMNGGEVVVFLVGIDKGPETLLSSSVFLLDTTVGDGMAWSSFPVAGLLGRRMHSAISVTAIGTQSPSRPYEHKQGEGKLDRPSSPEADAALIRGKSEALLWKPIIMEAASSKLEGAEVGSAGNHGASRGRDDDAKPQDGNNVPAFESILIFGGVADGSVIGDATLLKADGTLEQLPLGRRSYPTPECRYNHAMVSVEDGRQALLVGGCRGDGTRLHDAFVLDLTCPDERDGGDAGQEGKSKEAQNTTVTLDNGDVYTGQLDEGGRRHGEGRCEYLGSGGGWYIGTWEADEPHGRGERVYPAEGGQQDEGLTGLFAPGRAPPLASYRGHWKRGVRDGNGVCTFTMPTKPSAGSASSTVPDRYEGQWVGGVPLGKGVLHLRVTGGVTGSAIAALRNNSDSGNSSGGFIEGEWAEEGLVRGRETLPDRGGIYEGQYRQGRREGHGRLELSDGSEFEGAWKNGRQNGFGTFRCGVTRQVYTGKWVGGVRCGRGACDYASGCRYEGLWLDGKKHGDGILLLPTGDSLRGVWHRDELVPSTPDSAMLSHKRA